MINQELLKYFLSAANYHLPFRGKEDYICYQFANYLRSESIEGKLKCIWFHVANEIANNKNPVFGKKLKALGKIAGVADYVFLKDTGSFCIEVKEPKGKQSDNQKMFQKWCASHGVPYKMIYSSEEGIEALKEWGLIND